MTVERRSFFSVAEEKCGLVPEKTQRKKRRKMQILKEVLYKNE